MTSTARRIRAAVIVAAAVLGVLTLVALVLTVVTLLLAAHAALAGW